MADIEITTEFLSDIIRRLEKLEARVGVLDVHTGRLDGHDHAIDDLKGYVRHISARLDGMERAQRELQTSSNRMIDAQVQQATSLTYVSADLDRLFAQVSPLVQASQKQNNQLESIGSILSRVVAHLEQKALVPSV